MTSTANWATASIFIAMFVMFGFVMWAAMHYGSKSESTVKRETRVDRGSTPPTWASSRMESGTGPLPKAERIRTRSCPVPGCQIRKRHSHFDDFIRRMRGQ